MKRLLAVAALVLASSSAHAQYVIEYGGNTIRIDPERGTVSIPGVYDNTEQKKAKKTKREQDATRKSPAAADKPAQAPAEAAVTPAPPPQPPATAATAPAPAPATTAAAPASLPPAPAPAAPVQAAAPAVPLPAAPLDPVPPAQAVAAPVAPAAAAPTATAPVTPPVAPAAVPGPAPAPSAVTTAALPPSSAPAASQDPNSPIGIWLTEEKEGKIRIEPCGANLCGYSIDAKTNQNGEQILINMRPSDKSQEKKWSGRIFDPNSGSTYDSTIALKGSNSLRVQGCAFGGMFCGGQTWTRVN